VTPPPAQGRELALAALARVLGHAIAGVRDDTPLGTVGADPVALLLWADEVEAAGGATVPADGLAGASTVGDLAAMASATMAPEQVDTAPAGGSEESPA
jgi:hypothetical protein